MTEIFIVGEMRVAEGRVPEVTRILTELRNATRKEPGNIFYQFFAAEGKPGTFATIEHWKDSESEAAHWETDHLKTAVTELGPLLDGEMRVSRYNRGDGLAGCD